MNNSAYGNSMSALRGSSRGSSSLIAKNSRKLVLREILIVDWSMTDLFKEYVLE